MSVGFSAWIDAYEKGVADRRYRRAFEEWPFYPGQALSPSDDTLYDGELVDFTLHDVRDALTDELGEYCGGVWMSGRGETRRLNVAVTSRAPASTRAAVDAISAKAGRSGAGERPARALGRPGRLTVPTRLAP